MRKALIVPFFALAAAAVWGFAQQPTSPTVQVADHPVFGEHLVDGNGMSLYMFLNDRNGISNCRNACARTWTPLTVEGDPTAAPEVSGELLGTTALEDGRQLVTYNGRPLYYFNEDANPGDTGGQGTGAVWFLVRPDGERATEVETVAETTPADGEAEAAPAMLGAGIYTAEQAQRGKQAYTASCAACHHESLLGEQYAPALRGSPFLRNWGGRSVAELYEYIHDNMPFGAGGSLTEQQYIDIVAYILEVNEFPAGSSELAVDIPVLDGITIETQVD